YKFKNSLGQVSLDGKYLFIEGMQGILESYLLDADKVTFANDSQRLAQNGRSIAICPQNKLVCLLSGAGNFGAPGYSTSIYRVDNLGQPVFALRSGAYPQAVGFDPAAGNIYTQNHDTPLLIFDYATGAKKSEHSLVVQMVSPRSPRQILVHPD